jgi:hypothetical protein
VEITKEGRMVGDIAAPRVIIVDGASFRGRIDMGEVDVEAGREEARTAPRAAPRPAAVARPAVKLPEPKPAEKIVVAAPRPPAPPAPVAMGAVKRKVIVKRR